MDMFYVYIGIALVAAVVGFVLLIREPSPTMPTRDTALFLDQHTEARRQRLARLNEKAAKGLSEESRRRSQLQMAAKAGDRTH